jgi:hypothetical protein
MASATKIAAAAVDAIKDKADPRKLIQFSRAAKATTAGAVIERNPAMTPIRKARNRTYEGFTESLLVNYIESDGARPKA